MPPLVFAAVEIVPIVALLLPPPVKVMVGALVYPVPGLVMTIPVMTPPETVA